MAMGASNVHIGSPDATTRPVALDPKKFPTKVVMKVGEELKEVPVAYFEKVVLKTGHYTHPRTKEQFTITPKLLDDLARKANEMIAADIEIPTPLDHKDDQVAQKRKNAYFVSSKDNLGYVVQASREGDSLKFVQAAIGEDAALTAVRNRSSVYINDHTDCTGKNWGTCVVHSAYTPIPAVHGLGAPTSLSREDGPVILELARDEDRNMKLSKAQRARIANLVVAVLGMKKDEVDKLDDAELTEKSIELIDKVEIPDDGDLMKAEPVKKEIDRLNGELATKNSRVEELTQKLSKEDEDAPTAREVKLGRQSAFDKIDAKVSAGKISPAVGELIKKHVTAEPIKLCLSRTDDKPEDYEKMLEIAELSASAKPPKGTKLGRENPDDSTTEEDDDKKDQTKKIDSVKELGNKFMKSRNLASPVASKK